MRTRYIITHTNPDDIDPDGFDDNLEDCQRFTSEAKARKEFESLVNGRTNMHVYLLKVELVADKAGRLS